MKIITKNKSAYHDYTIDKEYEAGLMLHGHEVKSIKTGKININDAHAIVLEHELWLLHMDIPLYGKTSPHLAPGYDPKRRRKLLVHAKELTKITLATANTGYRAIPLQVYLTKQGRIKVLIGIGKLYRKVEKKQILKEKDQKKQMDREIKRY